MIGSNYLVKEQEKLYGYKPDIDTQEDRQYQDQQLDLGSDKVDEMIDFVKDGGMVL